MGLCGPSQQEQAIGNMESGFAQDLMNLTKQRAGDQATTISSINDALANLAAGKTPQGFSPDILAQMQSGVLTSVAGATRNAQQMAGNALAARGGGAGGAVPGGIEAQIAGTIASNMGAEESKLLQDVNMQNWMTGRENYISYIEGLNKMAELQDPSRLAGTSVTAGSQAFDAAHTMSMESAQAVADIAGAATGAVTSGLDVAKNLGAFGPKASRYAGVAGPMAQPIYNAPGFSETNFAVPQITSSDMNTDISAGLSAFQVPPLQPAQ